MDRRSYNHRSRDRLRELSKGRGYSREDTEAVLKTWLASMGAEGRKSAIAGDDVMDTSEILTRKRYRAPDAAVGNSDLRPSDEDKRCRVGDLHVASVAGTAEAKEHAQWRNPDFKSRRDATEAPAAEGGHGCSEIRMGCRGA